MTFGDAVVSAFTKYAVFSGRARRAEFWYFQLFNAITVTSMFFIALLFDAGDAFAGLLVLYWLATIVPRYALIWRRLQDTGRSGLSAPDRDRRDMQHFLRSCDAGGELYRRRDAPDG